MRWGRKRPGPAREPHPDGRIEAELQHVLSLQRSAMRFEGRAGDIREQLRKLDEMRRMTTGTPTTDHRLLVAQARELREERVTLEADISRLHEEAVKRLRDLGDDALYL